MATVLDIIASPTYTKMIFGLNDASVYDSLPASASVDITPPGFDEVTGIVFTVESVNLYTSETLEITDAGETTVALPDGVYYITYAIVPAAVAAITRSIMRVEKLQEKFDQAFMKLEMMECDKAIKTQAKVDLNTIYFFIQGSIAAANNCAENEAIKLYNTADTMLNSFIRNNCGCTGSNYIINYTY